MVTKTATLTIELCSDLCSGSGLSYAGVIDSDVIYDEYGFPYIPARRMKGCLREAAEMIGIENDKMKQLFGERGANAPGCLQIGNAVLKKAEELEKEIVSLRQKDEFKELLTPENILEVYTSVRAQTRIDQNTGSAEDSSLRFTRVVNQYDPFCSQNNKKNLCFFADLSWHADSEEQADERKTHLEQIAKATRNIGMNRNRGLGSVRCDLSEVKDVGEKVPEEQNTGISVQERGEDKIQISYVLENTDPLILSEDNDFATSSYISGKSVLGALAGTYIRAKQAEGMRNPADTEEFQNLFLNGKVQYANANPVAGDLRAYPAPLYLNQLKKTKKYVNQLGKTEVTENENKNSDYDSRFGNQPKLLKTNYVAEQLKENKNIFYQITEPETEMAYHHRHNHGENDLEEQLYTLEYLKSGQRFAGIIYAPKKYEECLRHLLASSNLRFGKSKSAQYGACKLAPNLLEDTSTNEVTYDKDDEIVVTLKSDAIFMNEDGCYTVYFPEVKKLLAEAIGIEYNSDYRDDKSSIQTKEVVGYNTTWNMKRAAVPAVRAGSAFVYKFKDDITEGHKWPIFVGERTQEGFGEIEIHSLSQMKYKVNTLVGKESVIGDSDDIEISNDMTLIICKVLREPLIERLMLNSPKEPNKLNSSNIGRITLMLKESLDASDTSDKAATEYWKRIHSIKSEYIDEVKKIVEKTTIECSQGCENDKDEGEKKEDKEKRYDVDTGRMYNLLKDSTIEAVLDKLGDNKNKLLKEIWGEYMLQYLTQLKYECKEGGK